jgi:hypothetical protein
MNAEGGPSQPDLASPLESRLYRVADCSINVKLSFQYLYGVRYSGDACGQSHYWSVLFEDNFDPFLLLSFKLQGSVIDDIQP